MALVGDKKLFRAVIVISQKISFLPEVILAIEWLWRIAAIICRAVRQEKNPVAKPA